MENIKAVRIVSGCGTGEFHVDHAGLLQVNHERELMELAKTMEGTHKFLDRQFWLFEGPNNLSTATAVKKVKAFIRAKRKG